jgi:hypothetical protein
VAVTSGSIPGTGTATLSEGALFYNGRVYKVDANGSLSTTSPDTLVWEIVESVVTGDPATFSDGNTYDFHVIEKFRLVAGAPGSGLANYDGATVKFLNKQIRDTSAATSELTNITSVSQSYIQSCIRSGYITNITVTVVLTVTTGASLTSLKVQLPTETPIYGSYFTGSNNVSGFISIRNNTTGVYEDLIAIHNGVNATDCYVTTDNKLFISMIGGTVSNGTIAEFSITFTGISKF